MKSRVLSLRYRLGDRTMLGRRFVACSPPWPSAANSAKVTHQVLMSSSIARYAARAPQDLRERRNVESRTRGVDEIAVGVDADTGAPHVDLVADRPAPLSAVRVRETRNERSGVDDQAEILAYCGYARGHDVVAAPEPDVDVSVGVRDERGAAGDEGLHRAPFREVSAAAVVEPERAVERGNHRRVVRGRDLRPVDPRTAAGHIRSGVQRRGQARHVEVHDAGEETGVHRIRSQVRDPQHRPPVDRCGRSVATHPRWGADRRPAARRSWDGTAASRRAPRARHAADRRSPRRGARDPSLRRSAGRGLVMGVPGLFDRAHESAQAVVARPLDDPHAQRISRRHHECPAQRPCRDRDDLTPATTASTISACPAAGRAVKSRRSEQPSSSRRRCATSVKRHEDQPEVRTPVDERNLDRLLTEFFIAARRADSDGDNDGSTGTPDTAPSLVG